MPPPDSLDGPRALPAPTREACALILLCALVQGLVLYVTLFDVSGGGPRADVPFHWVALALSLPTVLALTLVHPGERRFWQHLAAVAGVQGGMLAWGHWSLAAPDVHPSPIQGPLAAALCIATCVALPWLQGRQQHGGWRVPYADLFELAWQNALCLLLAGTFAGLSWTLLVLWALLFAAVGVDGFERLFFAPLFKCVASSLLFALGLWIARSQHRPLQWLRQVKLALCKVLLPPLALVAVLFALSLPMLGLEPLWKTRSAAWILLWMVALLVLFANAVWQDGRVSTPYPAVLRRLVEAGLLSLPLYALLALHALGLRIGQYGWTMERFQGFLVALVACGYGLGYACAVLQCWRQIWRGHDASWLRAIGPVNQLLSLLVIAAAVLPHTPLIDVGRIAAASQVARLRASLPGALDADILIWLRFDNGRRGYEALQALAQEPQMASLRPRVEGRRAASAPGPMPTAQETIAATLGRTSRHADPPRQRVRDVAALRQHIVRAPGTHAPPPDWWQGVLQGDLEPDGCRYRDSHCVLRHEDLDGDGRPEPMLCVIRKFRSARAHCVIHGPADPVRQPGEWHNLGSVTFHLPHFDDNADESWPALQNWLAHAPLRTRARRWPLLILGQDGQPQEVSEKAR